MSDKKYTSETFAVTDLAAAEKRVKDVTDEKDVYWERIIELDKRIAELEELDRRAKSNYAALKGHYERQKVYSRKLGAGIEAAVEHYRNNVKFRATANEPLESYLEGMDDAEKGFIECLTGIAPKGESNEG